MRKILVLHRYPPKQVIGTNASFIEFLSCLSRNRFEIYYLTYKDKSEKPEIEHLHYKFLPFYFNRGNNRDKLIKTILWILLTPFYVLYFQQRYHLDLVYCDDSVPYYGFLSKVISPKSKIIIRLGDLQTGYSLADNHPRLFKIALKFEMFMWSKLDGLIAISEAFKKFILDQGINAKKIKVVEESINLNEVKTTAGNLQKTGAILFHGSVVKCKGLKVLIDAFKTFNKKYPKTKLIIAGGGNEEAQLKAYITENKIKHIKFTGWYNHEELKKIMEGVQISVVMRSPNLANNFVVTTCLLENWANKKPVIVPDLESFKGVVENNKSGVFFMAGNAEDLSEKIEYLYQNTEIYEKLISGGLKTADKIFNHKKIAEKMVSTLSKFI